MDIVIAGGHGKIAMRLHPLLVERGHRVRALIRSPDQENDVRSAGAEPVVCDMEMHDDLSEHVDGADMVVFAAGAGPGSGAARKWTVDRDCAIKLMRAATKKGIRGYLMISAINVEEPRGNEVFQAYCKAKAEADYSLKQSGLDYTIIRPGRLTDEPGTGRVSISPRLPRGSISRDDVAAVIAEIPDIPAVIGRQFDLTSGDVPIRDAVMYFDGDEQGRV